MRRDDFILVEHILSAIVKIKKYCHLTNRNEFLKNEMLKDAVVRNIEIIGEAAKRLSEGFRKRYMDIPWKDISGMRDKIVHDYMGIDYRVVWDVIETDLASLERNLKKISKASKQAMTSSGGKK